MRATEVSYWDSVAEQTAGETSVYDNWLKRQLLGQFLLKCQWSGQKVLEIGVGNGVTAAMLALACGRAWEYIGTEMSPKFIKAVEKFRLNVVHADVLSLPEGSFTRIIALDSLEHVRLEDRPAGYSAIAERLAPGGLLFINMPRNESRHIDEFDHGIGISDLAMLEERGLTLRKYDQYKISYPDHVREYAFAVLTK
jgi:SAM-dependent methyltransferase